MKRPQKPFRAVVWTPVRGVLADFFRFLRRPRDVQCRGLTASAKAWMLATIFLLDFAVTMALDAPLTALAECNSVYFPNPFSGYSTWKLLLSVVLLGPLLEEAIFRGPLRYRKWLQRVIRPRYWKQKIFPALVWISILGFGALHIGNAQFEHYNPSPASHVVRALTALPQLFGGMTLTYIRVRLNFWWAWALHAVWNAIALALF